MKKISRHYLSFLLLPLFFASCATILNQPIERVRIATDKNVKVISVDKALLVDSTLQSMGEPKAYYVPRSFQPLIVTLQVDTVKKSVQLKACKSFAYWLNIYNYCLGMLVDQNNLKRYGYPPNNYISVKDTSIIIERFAPPKKGTLDLSLALDFLPTFNIKNNYQQQFQATGAFGIEGGLDYFYKPKHYLSLNVGGATSRFGEYFGPGYVQYATSEFASLKNNNVIGSFDIGYGLNVSNFQWRNESQDTTYPNQSISNISVGLSLSAQYRMGKYFRLGALYQPTLLNTSFGPAFSYQHYFAITLNWKFPLIGRPN
jgi:hypothetical protein